LLPIVIFVINASILGKTWIIDDAGIVFAYANNLANGYGLVPQPQAEHVEGFSDPLSDREISLKNTVYMYSGTSAREVSTHIAGRRLRIRLISSIRL